MIRYKNALQHLKSNFRLGKMLKKIGKLAAKLINSEFGKFERELRNSNDKWLWGWTAFFAAIVVIVVTVIGVALWLVVKSLIADRVEERLNGFQEAVGKVNILEGQLGVLKKEHAVSVLDNFDPDYPVELEWHNEAIKALSEEILLEIFRTIRHVI